MSEERPASGEKHGLFSTTQWSVVLAAGDSCDPASREALATLCGTYWYPVYALVRHLGSDVEAARDLTQAFFAHLLEKQTVKAATPDRGRFRSFLRTALRNYLDHERVRAQAQKRGGGQPVLTLDFDTAESRYRSEPAQRETPETIFEKRWARILLTRVLDRLREEMGEVNRERFQRLAPFLTEPSHGVGYKQIADELEMTETAVKGAVHRMRKRYGALLRDEVARTVNDPDEVEKEIRHLFSVVVA